jgi:hypothetical protein
MKSVKRRVAPFNIRSQDRDGAIPDDLLVKSRQSLLRPRFHKDVTPAINKLLNEPHVVDRRDKLVNEPQSYLTRIRDIAVTDGG